MNGVARAQLTFQTLTLLQNYSHPKLDAGLVNIC